MINVVYSCSDYYTECTGVSLYSLYENNKENEVRVFILGSEISEKNKRRLYSVAKTFRREIRIIDADEEFLEAAKKYNFEKLRGSYNTYSRIILNRWLSDLDKVIVIDSDTLVVGDLQSMWDVDINQYYYAAVPEVSMYGKYNYFEDADIVWKNDIYFNAGICVVNLKKWREDNIDSFLLQSVVHDSKEYLNSEQSIMNKFLGDKIRRIPLECNFYTTFHYANYEVIDGIFSKKHIIDRDEYEKAKEHPIIIHYCGFSYERPWFNHSVAYLKREYLKVRAKTPWKELPLKKWSNREQKFKYLYDVICYIMMLFKMYNLCLKFRLVFGQRIKGLIISK